MQAASDRTCPDRSPVPGRREERAVLLEVKQPDDALPGQGRLLSAHGRQCPCGRGCLLPASARVRRCRWSASPVAASRPRVARSCGWSSRLSGSVQLDGKESCALSRRELREARRDMQMVFQDPFASLNPRMTADRSGRRTAAQFRHSHRARRCADRIAHAVRPGGTAALLPAPLSA